MQGILQPLNILGKLGILEFVVIGTFFFGGGGGAMHLFLFLIYMHISLVFLFVISYIYFYFSNFSRMNGFPSYFEFNILVISFHISV